jgi:RNA polymerase sigma factor (sigma-70 family)
VAHRRKIRHIKPVSDAKADKANTEGGEDPLVQAYLQRRANLVRFFAARTGSPAAAEDLAQELYLKLAARPPGETAENPQALIYRIALNLMVDRTRGEARAAARDAQWRGAHRTSLAGEDIAEEPPADEATASRQRLRQLVEAVAELPPQMQRAFSLHKLEGLSHAETAQAMGISVKSVEKHISAALKNLTARLSK